MSATPSNADADASRQGAKLRPSRRDFLALSTKGLLTLSGLLALGGLWRFLSYRADPSPPTEFDLGPSEKYPPGSPTLLPEARAVLLHTSSGFVALSTTCPHLGCQVEPAVDGFACPCHGSRFDRMGGLQRGPADRPLRPLRVEETAEGHLILHTD